MASRANGKTTIAGRVPHCKTRGAIRENKIVIAEIHLNGKSIKQMEQKVRSLVK